MCEEVEAEVALGDEVEFLELLGFFPLELGLLDAANFGGAGIAAGFYSTKNSLSETSLELKKHSKAEVYMKGALTGGVVESSVVRLLCATKNHRWTPSLPFETPIEPLCPGNRGPEVEVLDS